MGHIAPSRLAQPRHWKNRDTTCPTAPTLLLTPRPKLDCREKHICNNKSKTIRKSVDIKLKAVNPYRYYHNTGLRCPSQPVQIVRRHLTYDPSPEAPHVTQLSRCIVSNKGPTLWDTLRATVETQSCGLDSRYQDIIRAILQRSWVNQYLEIPDIYCNLELQPIS